MIGVTLRRRHLQNRDRHPFDRAIAGDEYELLYHIVSIVQESP